MPRRATQASTNNHDITDALASVATMANLGVFCSLLILAALTVGMIVRPLTGTRSAEAEFGWS